jgi:transcriptional regulator with PAS, ATPase and Fis domain
MAFLGISRSTRRPAFAAVARYGLAVASVATALGTTLILRHYNFPAHFISHFTLIAIAITFWLAGTGPGLLAYLLSSLGVSILARNHFLLPTFALEPFLIFFAIASLLMGWFSASWRGAERLLIEARNNLELRVAERTGELTRANEDLQNTQAELRRREAYLAGAQRLSHTGSFGWSLSTGEILWSEETYRIFQYDRTITPTVELILQRVHPEDAVLVKQTIERATQDRKDFWHEYRLVMPDGAVKHVNVVVRALNDEPDSIEFVGAVMDITAAKEATTIIFNAKDALEKAFEEIKTLRDQLHKENIALREEIDKTSMFDEIVGSSEPLRRVLTHVAKVAATDSTVLILGETGTGKEMIARAIHRRSKRSNQAFIRVNCAAIPPSLIASELFGHEKGAFTGATQRRLGRFELAHGGTIFLDEIGELPGETQSALLRVLQEREFERVGGSQSVVVDVRVLSATNRDLRAAVEAGTFRQDLFFRLNVFPIDMPSLRERMDDIPLLVEYLIDHYSKKVGKKIRNINKKTLQLFQDYKWPGNIRELQNVIERAVVLCDSDTFSIDETWLKGDLPHDSAQLHTRLRGLGPLNEAQATEMIEAALAESGGRVSGPSGAAALLGVPRQTLESKITSLGINKHRFKSVRAPSR